MVKVKKKENSKGQQVIYQKVTIAQAARDVIIYAFEKGKFGILILAVIVIIPLCRMQPENIPDLCKSAFIFLSGYILCGIIITRPDSQRSRISPSHAFFSCGGFFLS